MHLDKNVIPSANLAIETNRLDKYPFHRSYIFRLTAFGPRHMFCGPFHKVCGN